MTNNSVQRELFKDLERWLGSQNPKPKNCMVRSCKALANCCCLHLEGERVGGLVGGHPATAGPQPLDTTRLPPPLHPPTRVPVCNNIWTILHIFGPIKRFLWDFCVVWGVFPFASKHPKIFRTLFKLAAERYYLASNNFVSDTGSTIFLVPLELGKTGHFKIIASKGLVIPNGSYFWALLASRLYTNFKKVVFFFWKFFGDIFLFYKNWYILVSLGPVSLMLYLRVTMKCLKCQKCIALVSTSSKYFSIALLRCRSEVGDYMVCVIYWREQKHSNMLGV